MPIELACDDGTLTLTADTKGHCRVTLRVKDREHDLGADALATVVQRLLAGVGAHVGGPPSGKLDGKPVRFVMTLFERHGTMFAADDDAHTVLFVQGSDGTRIAKLTLTVADRERWVTILRAVPKK